MTGIKPTVSLFRVWQRELNEVLTYFSTTYTFYYCGYALTLPWSSCYSSHVIYCDCDQWRDHLWPSITPLWHCDQVMWYFPALHLVVVSPIRKEKKRKRNINNDLAVLPSHDKLVHKPGIQIIVTDTLSCRSDHAVGIEDNNNNLTMLPLHLFPKEQPLDISTIVLPNFFFICPIDFSLLSQL